MKPKRMQQDTRGLSSGILGFVSILVIGALLFTMLNGPVTEVFSMSLAQTNSQQATDAINQRQQIWGGVLFFVMFLASLSLIFRAVFETRGPS